MFLHLGASLHGHEFSNRNTPATGHAAPRRNSLLRSSFSTPVNRASPYADSPSPSPTVKTTGTPLKRVRPRPVSDYSPASLDTVVRFLEPLKHEPVLASKPEAMYEDDASTIVDISDSDTSRAASSTRRPRRQLTRQRTSYVLAQAPPSLNKKQRFIHIRPKLLLQLQQVPVNQRPRPTIDVYPTSGIVNTAIAAHLCKRFPRLSRIKSEKSIQDVLLLKSEDYAASELDSDSDADEESITNRDIIAILSPLTGQDKAEIVLPDGTVWVASPRTIGGNFSYEFTTVDEHGITTTARWVRRQVHTKSLLVAKPTTSPPTSPLSPMSMASTFPFPPPSPPLDYKFTFSIINSNCRRHPIMATLQPSSLEIQDTYTSVSQSSSKYPPTSPQLAALEGAESEREPTSKWTLPVEEWQKSFIQISSLWVALRHGWVPHFKLADFIPQSASVTSSVSPKKHNRSRSYTTGTDLGSSTTSRTLTGRLRNGQPLKESTFTPGVLPRRATSTGAARMQKIRAERLSGAPEIDETCSIKSKGRRVLSGDWSGSTSNRHSTNLADIKDLEPIQPKLGEPAHKTAMVPLLNSGAVTPSKRPVSDYISSPAITRPPYEDYGSDKVDGSRQGPLRKFNGLNARKEEDGTRKQQRWKSVTTWFSKLRAR
ncbi:hypothetical protein SCARD494_07191 [Seiridium cardinale]